MPNCSAKIYEGSEKYIFISYSHRDSAKVFPILEALSARGYRIWYDEGIDPGTEWPETIASHLERAAVFIAFVSPNSVQSNNCRREVNFALSKDIGFLSIMLEDTVLSPGLEMQLSAYQSIHYFKAPSDDYFYTKLFETTLLDPCRDTGAAPESAPEKAAPEQPEQPEQPAPETAAPPKKKKKTLAIVLAAALALLIAAGVLAVLLKDKLPAKNPGPGDAPASNLTTDDVYHITLQPGPALHPEDVDTALDGLKARLDVLAGENGYDLQIGEEQYELTLPKEATNGCDIAMLLRAYLIRPIELYAVDKSYIEDHSMERELKKVEISRADIEDITTHTGTVAGIDADALGFNGADYTYFIITLKAEKIAEIDRAFSDAVIAFDVENSTWYYLGTVRGEGNTFYLVDDNPSRNVQGLNELVLHNLTHDPLPGGFSFRIDPLDDTVWETADGGETFGELQREADSFTEKTVVYFISTTSETQPGALSDDIAELKARLDLLGEPYAFGRVEDEEAVFLAVKTTVRHTDPAVMRLLCTNLYTYSAVSCNYRSHTVSYSGSFAAFAANAEAGSVSLNVPADTLNKLAEEPEDAKVYLMGNGSERLLVTDVKTLKNTMDQGEIRFSKFAGDEKSIGSNAEWLVALLNRLTETKLNFYYYCDESYPTHQGITMTHVFVPDENGAKADDSVFLLDSTASDRKIANALAAATDKEVTVKKDGIYVSLDLPLDENLVESCRTLIPQIFGAIDFDSCNQTGFTFYLTAEPNDERTRVILTKRNAVFDDDDEGGIYVHGIFLRGDTAPYQEAFKKYTEEDPFLQKYTNSRTSWSF